MFNNPGASVVGDAAPFILFTSTSLGTMIVEAPPFIATLADSVMEEQRIDRWGLHRTLASKR
jgi:hypothetical protein